jgi:flavin-dependent dehydrogenase
VPGSVIESDIVVIGGGPAGSTAAQLLASWGRSVTIVHRPTAAHLTLAESLPASTRKLLRFLGQLDRVDAAAFHPNTGNRAAWAGASRVTTSADAGFHVPREAFDRVLRDHAQAAGARLIDAAIQRVDGDNPIRLGGVTADGHSIEHRARYALDCSGRAGVVARHGLRRAVATYRTLAIVAEWECADWPPDEHTCTTIESYGDGWAWSVPLSARRRQCTVMVDPPSLAGRSSTSFGVTGLPAIYATELGKAKGLHGRLAGARQVSAPWTCNASLYDCARAAEGPVLLVGDAASFIEPLSSAGVKKALLSAWRAAVVTNTCLANPAMASAACDLYVRREREVYSDCLRRSSAFFAEANRMYGTPFWSARAAHAPGTDPSAEIDSGDPSDDSLRHDASVRDAFERLRGDEAVRIRPADALQFASVPTIDGRQVVMREALVVPGGDTPLHYAAGVDLAQLARIVAGCADVPAIIAAYRDTVAPVPIAGVLTGLSFLIARQALVAETR